MIPSIIIPDPAPGQRQAPADYAEFIRQWRADYAEGKETIPPPQNVRFIHDIHWRDHPLSLTFIRAAAHGATPNHHRAWAYFWQGIGVLFVMAQSLWVRAFIQR